MVMVSQKKSNGILYPSKIDVAVLLLFFAREEQTTKVFEQIRLARPTKLFLYQDGPREGRDDDVENITNCRAAVEAMIDWDCEVHRLYQEKNKGCDPSEYLSQKWMFSFVDKGIILEDDDVPSQSFFPFCKDLLDRYENDLRVGMICGVNRLGKIERKSSYIFTCDGGIWGWATWKRTIDAYDISYEWMKDSLTVCNMNLAFEGNNSFLSTCKRHHESGVEYYESLVNAVMRLNGQLMIVPTHNMITNIGIATESTHAVSDVRVLPKVVRCGFFAERYEIDFPLKHPKYVNRDYKFEKEQRPYIRPNRWEKFCRQSEYVFNLLKYGKTKYIMKKVKEKMIR